MLLLPHFPISCTIPLLPTSKHYSGLLQFLLPSFFRSPTAASSYHQTVYRPGSLAFTVGAAAYLLLYYYSTTARSYSKYSTLPKLLPPPAISKCEIPADLANIDGYVYELKPHQDWCKFSFMGWLQSKTKRRYFRECFFHSLTPTFPMF